MKKLLLLLSAALLLTAVSCTEKNKPESEEDPGSATEYVQIYGKWKPVAEWNSKGWYHRLGEGYIEWLIIKRDGSGSWDGDRFNFTFDPENMTFTFWEHKWTVFELTEDLLRMGATEDGYSEGYEWERAEVY